MARRDLTGSQFWGPLQEGRKRKPFKAEVYEAVGTMWADAWRHANGTMCPECAPQETELTTRPVKDVCAILLMVRVET